MTIKYVEKSLIIELNGKIISEWNARHQELPEFLSASEERLDEIFCIVDKVGNNLDTTNQIIVKTAYLLSGRAITT